MEVLSEAGILYAQLHCDAGWWSLQRHQTAGAATAKIELEAAELIKRYHEALVALSAEYRSPPCTVQQGAAYLAEEFQRRLNLAAEALEAKTPSPTP